MKKHPSPFSVLFGLLAAWFAMSGILKAVELEPSLAVERVNLTSAGEQYTESFSVGIPSISANGRYVVFTSQNALVAEDTNGYLDVYLRDRQSGTTTLVSLTHLGGISNYPSTDPVISADGSAVAFVSSADNLVSGDTNNTFDVFVRDLIAGTTTRVSVGTGNVQAIGASGLHVRAAISDNGRYVTFYSAAANLVAGDTNAREDIFRHDRNTGNTVRVSIASDGTQSDTVCIHPAISGDGTKVAFVSSTDQFGGNPQFRPQVWLRDLTNATTELITKDGVGNAGNGSSYYPDLSFDGRYVVFESDSTNLVTPAGGANAVFRRDRQTGNNEVVSVTTAGSYASGTRPAISADGRHVAFGSTSVRLVLGDTNGRNDIFIRDLLEGKTGIASRTSTALQSNLDSHEPCIADTTGEVVFRSSASNLVPGDTNDSEDVFVSTPVFPSSILINEVDAVTATGSGQFIELYDGGAGATSLSGLVLVLYNGSTDTSYAAVDLDGRVTDEGGYFLVGSANVWGVEHIIADGTLQGGVDAVALYRDNAVNFPNGTPVTVNRLVDAVVHENNQSNDSGLLVLLQSVSEPQADEAEHSTPNTESVQRFPNGSGYPGGTGVYRAYAPTPGKANGVPFGLDLSEGSDTGSSNTDDLTRDTTPTLTGTAPANASVSLNSSLAGVVGTTTATASGTWSITPSSALGEGIHLFSATADGGAASDALSVTIDTTAPASPTGLDLDSATDSGASSSDNVTADNTPTIGGDAIASALVTLTSDLDGDVGALSPNSPWSIVASSMSDGVHSLTATATDAAGNESVPSTALAVTIDTVKPSVTIDRAWGQADPASAAPIVFTVAFDENVSGFIDSDVSLAGSALPASATVSDGPAIYEVSVGTVDREGLVTASIPSGIAEDLAGNTNTAGTSTDNSVEVDFVGPTAVPLTLNQGSSPGFLGTGDTDGFSFTLTTARRVVISTSQSVDTLGVLKNANGDVLNNAVADDNGGDGNNFRIERTLAAGTYRVEVSGTGVAPTGDYFLGIDGSANPDGVPDTLVGRSLASAVGNNLYGAGQVVTIPSRRAAPVSGFFAVENDGQIDDGFLLQGGRGTSFFNVTYTNALAGNITAGILAGTAPTGTLAPGAPPYVVNVRVVPNRAKLTVKKRVGNRLLTSYLKKTLSLSVGGRSQLEPGASDLATIKVMTR
jgi:Tol biopolymer transport system component